MTQGLFLPNSTPSHERIQVVDDQKKFRQALEKQITRWGLDDAGLDYNVVAVFGSQSTGKSTLLNHLFGTNFDVVNKMKREQTTRGIWMSKANSSNILVMDVEGTDGRERGEDKDFERKSALFSLASSEVLIINLWEHQVGLHQGANLALLKTVFEVHLGLSGKPATDGNRHKTLLLFVIRDNFDYTPMENLVTTLTSDMEKIWDTTPKPPELEDCQMTDYIDLSFTTLSHKFVKPDKFEAEVTWLRGRFTDKARGDYIFKPAYHKRVPADGIAFYMRSVWEQVQSNKALDIPTQQELLAHFRCDEISAQALAGLNEQLWSQCGTVKSGCIVGGLGKMMQSWWTAALAKYDCGTGCYHKGVSRRKRADLVDIMETALSPLFLGQLRNLHESCLASFQREILQGISGVDYSFTSVVSDARSKFEQLFETSAKEMLIEGVNWSYDEADSSFRGEIQWMVNKQRRGETKKMINAIARNFRQSISEPVATILMNPTPDMWDKVLIAFREKLPETEETHLTKAKSIDCTNEEIVDSLAALRCQVWQALRARIDDLTTDVTISGTLKAHFESIFRYDADGLPRVWRWNDDFEKEFKLARDSTLSLVHTYSEIKPVDTSLEYWLPSAPVDPRGEKEEFDFESTLRVLSESRIQDISSQFQNFADVCYAEVKPSAIWSSGSRTYGALGCSIATTAAALFPSPPISIVAVVGTAGYGLYTSGIAETAARAGWNAGSGAYCRVRERLWGTSSPPQPVPAQPLHDADEPLDEDGRRD